jgi:NAD(P)-dependent dehydrogenase (short-subunit alcohol dehydrogenase family)
MALGFADHGTQLIVVSRKEQSCREVVDEIAARGGSAVALPGHVGDWNSLEGLVEAAIGAFGRVDVLVNNAGIAPVAESSAAMGEALFDKPSRAASTIVNRCVGTMIAQPH